MPFINGRYHVNPIMGHALEAAREAEAAMLALQQQARKNYGDASASAPEDHSADPDDPSSADPADAQAGGPIHHIEIEATELVPSNSGRATRGFVARVHRAAPSASVVTPKGGAARNPSSSAAGESPLSARNDSAQTDRAAPPPETHFFSDHGDLVNFFREALAKDSPQR
jgi:hypothetical protein